MSLGITRQCRPAKGPFAFAEQRANVGGHKTRVVERARVAAKLGLTAQRVAVVEDLGARVHEADHRFDVAHDRRARPIGELLGLLLRVVVPVVEVDVLGQVAERIVRRGLVSHDVDLDAAAKQLGKHGRRVAHEPDAERNAIALRLKHALERGVEVARPLVEVALVDSSLQARRIDVDAEAHAVVHGDGERLRAAHAARACGQREGPGERAAKALVGDGSEGLVRALQDALGADVDPRAGRHLAVHRETERFEATELRPRRPVRHQVGVRDQDPRRPLVGLQDADRSPGLDEHGLVGLERA